MFRFVPFILVCVLACVLVADAAARTTYPTGARAVSLSDADRAPDFLRILYPARKRTPYGRQDERRPVGWHVGRNQCGKGRAFSDVSAYRWHGGALGAQRRGDDGWYYWRGRRGSVSWDGLTFWNGTRAAVLVAGWCER